MRLERRKIDTQLPSKGLVFDSDGENALVHFLFLFLKKNYFDFLHSGLSLQYSINAFVAVTIVHSFHIAMATCPATITFLARGKPVHPNITLWLW